MEAKTELAIYMAQRLASELNLETGIAPTIIKAFRVGVRYNPRRRGSRNIITTFMDYRTKS